MSPEDILGFWYSDRVKPHWWNLYMPFMHAESREAQVRCCELFLHPTVSGQHDYAVMHHDIVDRFGRFPHRNAILGRESTPEEVEFLEQPGSSF